MQGPARSAQLQGTGSQMCLEEMVPRPGFCHLGGGWEASGSGLSSEGAQSQQQLLERSEGQASPALLPALPASGQIWHFPPSDRGLSVCIEASLFWGLSSGSLRPW